MSSMDNTQALTKNIFTGDKKHLIHFLVPYEKKLIDGLLPLVPLQLGTAQLTLMTILWSIGVIATGYLAQKNIQWLWGFSACILAQYVSDMLDGAVGRMRNTGLIKWGFYMDHFLDYVFLSSIIIGYSFLLPASYGFWTLACLACSAGFMMHVLMDFSITGNFKISCNYFGVSEARLTLVIFNTILIFAGQAILVNIFPFFVVATFAALVITVYACQKVYRHIDAIHQSKEESKAHSLNQHVQYQLSPRTKGRQVFLPAGSVANK